MPYPGLFNSSYEPDVLEKAFINTPNNRLGPILSGQTVVALLQGVMFVQYLQYVQAFRREKRWTEWLVHLAFALCFLKFAYIWACSWDTFVSHYGDWHYLTTFNKMYAPIGISTTLPSAVCQLFFIHRCWVLSRNWFFLISAVASLLLTLGSAVSLTYGAAVIAGSDNEVTGLILTSINLSLASGLICDIIIASFTCFYLIRERTGFEETDTLVMCLVKCSIESVLGPTIVALVNLILSNLATNNQWFLFPNFALSHVYGASLLYSVNARTAPGRGSRLSTTSTYSKPSSNSRFSISGGSVPPSRYNELALQDRTERAADAFVGVVRKDSAPECIS